MHVRGFTRHTSSSCAHPGTYLALIEKIPYLKKLGINAVELMPIFEFDETHSKYINPENQEPLPNYWGYNSLHFFAPMRRYAVADPISEFKTLVRELHRNGICILLDVVYNHTGEGKEKEYAVNFRGIDNASYYIVDESGAYKDYAGCGNTVNGNFPPVQEFIIDSLRYWAGEMGVDGFRFDLAACLLRDPQGNPIDNSPLIQAISQDPLLSQKKLIAEAWDATGLYLIGKFPQWGRWKDWDGPYRDRVRRFIKGTSGYAGLFATALCGNEPIYSASKTPLSRIHFVTCHDGYSLCDLVSYECKHNRANGENSRDGGNQNDSWNCGVEGFTADSAITALRERQMRNFFLALFTSQGIPMLLMGDEYGHTRRGNNNPYGQDNELNWFLWNEVQSDKLSFVSGLIAFRKNHKQFTQPHFLKPTDITWHGETPKTPNWSSSSRLVACSLKNIYLAFNANYLSAPMQLPEADWRVVVDTTKPWANHHLLNPTSGEKSDMHIEMAPHSGILLYRS